MPIIDEGVEPVEINIDPSKVCFIIVKAREFDAKVDPVEPDPGSEADDGEREILEDYANDPTLEELRGAINNILDDDEMVDLIALSWVGCGDFDRKEWANARALARERHTRNSANYLIGMPELGDFLEEGLAELGYGCEDEEAEHL